MLHQARQRTKVLAIGFVVSVASSCGSTGADNGANDDARLYCIEGNAGACGCGYSASPIAEVACPPTTQTPGWFWYCSATETWPASGASCDCGAYSCIDDSAVPTEATCSCGLATPGVSTTTTCPAPGTNDACCLGADGTCTCYYGTNSCSKAEDLPVPVATCDAMRAATATMAAMKGTAAFLPMTVTACH